MSVPVEAPSAPAVRVWSPTTVAVYGLLLGFPAGIVLALRNWKALGLRREVRTHLAGAIVFSLLLIAVLQFAHPRLGRLIGLASSIATFSYLKAKLASDIADVRSASANPLIDYRRWYTALGWVALAYLVFLLMLLVVVIVAIAAGIPIPD